MHGRRSALVASVIGIVALATPMSAGAQFNYSAALSASTGYSDNVTGLPNPAPGQTPCTSTSTGACVSLPASGGITNVTPALTLGYGTARVNTQARAAFSLNTTYSPDADPATSWNVALNLLSFVQAGPRSRVTLGVFGSVGKTSALNLPAGGIGAANINQDIQFVNIGGNQALQLRIGSNWLFTEAAFVGFFRPINQPTTSGVQAATAGAGQGDNLNAGLNLALAREWVRWTLRVVLRNAYLANLNQFNPTNGQVIADQHQGLHTGLILLSRTLGRNLTLTFGGGAQVGWTPGSSAPAGQPPNTAASAGAVLFPTGQVSLNYALDGWSITGTALHNIQINLLLGQSVRATGGTLNMTVPIGRVLRTNLFLRLFGSYNWQEPLNITTAGAGTPLISPGAHIITGATTLTYRFAGNFAVFGSFSVVKQIDTDPAKVNIGDLQRVLGLAGVTAAWPNLSRREAAGGGSVLLRRAQNPTQLATDKEWKALFNPNPGKAGVDGNKPNAPQSGQAEGAKDREK